LTAAPAAAEAASGGARFDRPDPVPASSGAARFGQRVRKPVRRPALRFFHLRPANLFLYGRPARARFRIDSRARHVRVTLVVRRRGSRRVVRRIRLGRFRTRRAHRVRFAVRTLPEGRYVVVIRARDRRGRALRRARVAGSRRRVRASRAFGVRGHRFPLRGSFSFGGSGARFGADRGDHSHGGQDLPAAAGTPIVAPRGGLIEHVGYQASGAGHYVVLDGAGEDRDYVFMHMRSGSTRVRRGQRVVTGQRLGDVGNTGRSFGAHLHFEIWVGGGWYSGGHAVDPLPALRRWNRWS
jgi:murein DD-endopeptidase MepM/ murein hydrolase activator NlpD